MPGRRQNASVIEVFLRFLRLDCTFFGGPIAHIPPMTWAKTSYTNVSGRKLRYPRKVQVSGSHPSLSSRKPNDLPPLARNRDADTVLRSYRPAICLALPNRTLNPTIPPHTLIPLL